MKKGWASAGGNRWEVGNTGDHNTKWAGGGFENKGCWTKCLMPRAGSKYLPATSFSAETKQSAQCCIEAY